MYFVVTYILNVLVSTCLAIMFTRCELVNELRRQGFPEFIMNDLVCLIGEASHYRTHVISGPGPDGSNNFGLFQINDRYWCNSGPYPGKACSVRCSDLLLDDITEAASCAKKILRLRGLYAWPVWEKFCLGTKYPNNHCADTLNDIYVFNSK